MTKKKNDMNERIIAMYKRGIPVSAISKAVHKRKEYVRAIVKNAGVERVVKHAQEVSLQAVVFVFA